MVLEKILKSMEKNIDNDRNYMVLSENLRYHVKKRYEPKKIKICVNW